MTRAPEGAPQGGSEPQTTAPDFSFIPADYQKDGQPDLAAFSAHYNDLVARDAQAAERAGQIPEAYQFTPSEGLSFDGIELPEGFSVNLATDDPSLSPLFDELGGFLKEIGAPASAASKVSDLLARYEAVKYSQSYAAHKAEMQALGTPAQQTARLLARNLTGLVRREDAVCPDRDADRGCGWPQSPLNDEGDFPGGAHLGPETLVHGVPDELVLGAWLEAVDGALGELDGRVLAGGVGHGFGSSVSRW